MATNRELQLQKRYKLEEQRVNRMMAKFSAKYGRNWTKNTLTARENSAFLSALRRQKRAIDALVKLDIESGRLKRRTV